MRGSSLVETILAIFVLALAASFAALSFQRSLQYQTTAQNQAQGLAFADMVLDQLRQWSRDPVRFRGSWTAWASVTDPTYPDYEARVSAVDRPVALPCSELSLGVSAPERRSMATSCKFVEVAVFHRGQQAYRLDTLIGEPERLAASVSVTAVSSIPSLLARDGVVEFQAQALDSSGAVIPDVSFIWTTAPLTGNGSVAPLGDGRRAALANVVFVGDGTLSDYTGGQVQVRAFCIVRGREVSGLSPAVNLQP